MLKFLPQKEVLNKFKKAHGDYYNYSLVEYKGYREKTIFKGEIPFLQTKN